VSLGPAEQRRYSRHLVMPEVGREGQERLAAASVLVVGAGGLGSPAALYLASAGVGRLGLMDFDQVEESNLHRQILFSEADIGQSKVAVAAARLAEINPHVEIEAIAARLNAGNAVETIGDYDLVVDGSDNFPTRYLVNDACVQAGRPDVFGSVLRFEGQVSVFAAPTGPCYRCLFPEPPPPGVIPSCAEAGVLGVLPGIIGSLQAHEAIKLLLGLGSPLVGRLLVFDGIKMKFREIAVPRRPDCPTCAPGTTQKQLVEYEEACVVAHPQGRETHAAQSRSGEEVPFEISPSEVQNWRDAGRSFSFVDVRMPREFEVASVAGTTLLPLHELPQRFAELDRGQPMVVMCHHGIRSAQAVAFLRSQGFPLARNLTGGIAAWARDVDGSIPQY